MNILTAKLGRPLGCIRIWMTALILAAAALVASPAMAWDAGPSECAHDPCTGGRNSDSIPDTKPKWANSEIPGRLADCPGGYSNIGIGGCGRGADRLPVEGSRLGSCPSGYYNNGTWCAGSDWDNFYKSAGYPSCEAGWSRGAFSRCYKDCPAGYYNNGTSCWRDAGIIGPSNFRCNAGERLGGGLVANKCFPQTPTNPGPCSEDREEYGVSGASLCFTKCPPNSSRTAISTCTHKIRWRGNTHLFIVQNALTLLQREVGDAIAQRAAQVMNAPACKARWEQGLWDGDDGGNADAPGGKSGSHFYNANGRDEQGNPTSTKTYKSLGKEQNEHGNAKTNAAERLALVGNLSTPDQCYQLGLALHYMTDMTMPMHASSFSGGGLPLYLHPTLESYVPFIQGNYLPAANTTWDRYGKGLSADDYFEQASIRGGRQAPALMATMKYDGTICTMLAETHSAGAIAGGTAAGLILGPGGAIAGGVIAAGVYSGPCFLNDPAVNQQIGSALRDGYQSTASYLYAAFRTAGGVSASTPSTPLAATAAPLAAAAAPMVAVAPGGALNDAAVVGNYRHLPVQNAWHEGSIVSNGGQLRWVNKAGASWSLTPDYARRMLVTGADNPYQASGPRNFLIQLDAQGRVAGFNFGDNGGLYQLVPAVAAAAPAAPTAATAAAPATVSLFGAHGRYVGADANGRAYANRTAVGPWEKFIMTTNANGTVSFRTAGGLYLVAEADGTVNANRGAIGPWESFTLVRNANGTVSFKTAHGKFVVAEPDGRLNANRDAIGPWESFRLQ